MAAAKVLKERTVAFMDLSLAETRPVGLWAVIKNNFF
jgi:hypothetical protein